MKFKKYSEPPFWEDSFIEKEPISKNLIRNFLNIKNEVLRLKKIANILFARYPAYKLRKVKSTKHYFIADNTDWKIAPFFGGRYDANAKRRSSLFLLLYSDLISFFVRLICPKTYSLLKYAFKNGILLNAYFAQLSPGSFIKPHYHPIKDGIYRMNLHLGLVCDPECKITVGEETRTWEEGKLLAFKNSGPYRHSVEHKGTKDRIILIVELDVKYLEQYGVYKGHRILNS